MFKPQFEALEDRSLPSGGSMLNSVSIVGNSLNIIGTNRSDIITFTVNEDASARIYLNGAVTHLEAAEVIDFIFQPGGANVNIWALGGNDWVRVTLAPNLVLPTVNLNVTVNLGSGNDVFYTIADGVTLDGTNLTLTGNGGSGNDHLIASGQFLDLFNNAVATVLLNGDSGDDVIRTDTTGIVEFGSTLNYRANGGDGRDFVIGVHRFEAGSNGTINAAVIGGRGRDHLALWLIQESGFDTPTINGLMDGGDLARNHQSRDREDMIATDNVFVTNFGPGSRGQRYTIVPGI